MRCPKCGYISFDHLEKCVKCKKNIKAVSDNLRGTVFQADAPSFLQLQPRQEEDESMGLAHGEEDFVDEDLEILIEESPEAETEIEFGDDSGGLKLDTDDTPEEPDEEEDREIEIDFSQFAEASAEEPTPAKEESAEEAGEEKSFSLEMPEELADISDLAPPVKEAEIKQEPVPAAEKPSGDPDLDELDFNLELDDLEMPAKSGTPAETELSLDDLDFSETLSPSPKKAQGKAGADMDEELNFDLDLGGLSIHKDQ